MIRLPGPVRGLLLLIIPVLLAFGVYRFLYVSVLTPLNPADQREISVEISPGLTFKEICHLLEEKGVIRRARSLDLLARLRRAPVEKISAGEYLLSASMDPRAILAKLVSGQVLDRIITVPEGMSIREIGNVVEKAGLISKADFDRATKDPGLLARAGVASSSFEGYLFPDTYKLSRPITPDRVVWLMFENGEKHWPPEFTAQADTMRLTRHDILTLASIIEKESSKKLEEQPVIASVFHNRLKAGMKLQSDPTVIYGLKDFNGNLTKEDLMNPHSFNTYVNYGLPPGPICNPGDGAIKAALFPASTPYLYFAADGSGGHVFSTTLTEHNENVRKYLK